MAGRLSKAFPRGPRGPKGPLVQRTLKGVLAYRKLMGSYVGPEGPVLSVYSVYSFTSSNVDNV